MLSLQEAASLVNDGDILALGGSALQRPPAAFARELARQGKKDLQLVKTSGAYDVDLLCMSGCAAKVHSGYIGFENEGLAPNYRRAVESGQTIAEEHACYSVIAALRAAAYGVPFMPVNGFTGSQLLQARNFPWIRDPFAGVELVVAVPRIQPDWAIVHVHEADSQGNARILGSRFEDVLMTRAAKQVIVTTEKIVSAESFQKCPEATAIPAFLVAAVVEAPGGSLPISCHPYYSGDSEALGKYLRMPFNELTSYLREVN